MQILSAHCTARIFQFSKLGLETWRIAGPMDGGGMEELDDKIVMLWRCHSDLYLARRGGKAEQLFAAGGNAVVTLRPEGMYAAWSGSEGMTIKAPNKEPRVLSATGAFPAIAPGAPVIVA